MWGNDQVGDCVMVAQANFETVLQYLQQKSSIPITTGVVENQYYREQGATGAIPSGSRDGGTGCFETGGGITVGRSAARLTRFTPMPLSLAGRYRVHVGDLLPLRSLVGIALPLTAQLNGTKDNPGMSSMAPAVNRAVGDCTVSTSRRGSRLLLLRYLGQDAENDQSLCEKVPG